MTSVIVFDPVFNFPAKKCASNHCKNDHFWTKLSPQLSDLTNGVNSFSQRNRNIDKASNSKVENLFWSTWELLLWQGTKVLSLETSLHRIRISMLWVSQCSKPFTYFFNVNSLVTQAEKPESVARVNLHLPLAANWLLSHAQIPISLLSQLHLFETSRSDLSAQLCLPAGLSALPTSQ